MKFSEHLFHFSEEFYKKAMLKLCRDGTYIINNNDINSTKKMEHLHLHEKLVDVFQKIL